MRISYSSWATWKRCPQLFLYQYVDNYQARTESKAINFGTLLHSFLEQYHKEGETIKDFDALENEVKALMQYGSVNKKYEDPNVSILSKIKERGKELGILESKNIYERYSIPHALTLALEYMRMYSNPREVFSVTSSELKVEMPFRVGKEDHVFSGVLDIFGWDGDNLIVEHKTSGSLWDFNDKASLSFQKVGYVVLAGHLGYSVNRVLYNGLKTALGPRDKTLITDPSKNFSRVLVSVHDYEVEQWWESLQRDMVRIMEDVYDYKASKNKPDGCLAYGGCAFKEVCKSSEEVAQSILEECYDKNKK